MSRAPLRLWERERPWVLLRQVGPGSKVDCCVYCW